MGSSTWKLATEENPSSSLFGFSLVAGNLLNGGCPASNSQIDNFIKGWTWDAGYYDIVGGGLAHNSNGTALETGFGFGAGGTYSSQSGGGGGW